MRFFVPVTVIALALSACNGNQTVLHEGSDSPVDAATTSLAGSAACETLTCGSGELCVEQESGVANDAGVATVTTSCVAVSAGCVVADCEGSACPTCIAELCAYYPSFNDPELSGRTLGCPGE